MNRKAKAILVAAAIICSLIGTGTSKVAATGSPSTDNWPTNGWRTTTPEAQGMNSGMLAAMVKVIRDEELNVDSITIVRNGYLVMDSYFYPFPENNKHNLRSASKSVMSALIGIAIDKGYIKDVHQPVLSFFPDKTIANLDENKKMITLEHLLTMTTGLRCIDGYRYKNKGLYELQKSSDWAQYVLDLPMVETPGALFEYCSGATYLLSAILQQATGMRSLEFAEKYLFAPLGISDAYWETNPQGIDYGYDQLLLTPRDMAKIGWLYLNRGEWEDGQVIPAAWVADSTRGHIRAGTVADQYGYQWWVEKDYYMAVGSGGQFIFVAPEKNIVAAVTSAAPMLDRFLKVRDLLKNYIIPSAVSENPLPSDPERQKRLEDLLATVRPQPVRKPLSPMPEISGFVSGRTYVFDDNLLGLQSLTLTFKPDSDEAWMKMAMAGNSRELKIGLDNIPRFTKIGERLFAYKGTWINDNTFVYAYRYADDNNFGDAHLEFAGENIFFAAYHKTNSFTYRASGRLSDEDRSWLSVAMDHIEAWFDGEPELPPDTIKKNDIVGIWHGTDSYNAEITFNFNKDGTFKVIRNPSSLGRPSIGTYTISDIYVTGEADTKVNFVVQKFGEEIKGKWTYTVNGASAEFTLNKQ